MSLVCAAVAVVCFWQVMEPECAELLLLAGRHSPLFARIRCVIFDEVHNIVSKEGSVWEHLLTFINAPFVALSATVGNPEEFMGWLQRLETVRDPCPHELTVSHAVIGLVACL